MLVGSPVMAGNATLSWTAPTARVDGTPLDVGEITTYKVYAKGTSSYALVATVPSPTTTVKITGITGTKNYVVRATDVNGLESADSNVAKVSTSPPDVPNIVKVTLSNP